MNEVKVIDFYGNRKKFFIISAAIIILGLLVNVIFGTKLSINFSGGASLSYSYSGEVALEEVESAVKDAVDKDVTATRGTTLGESAGDGGTVILNFAGKDALSDEEINAITEALKSNFKDNNMAIGDMMNVNPTVGLSFFLKGLYTILIAGILMVLYVAARFRKIGGWSAGIFALIAVLHDCLIAYLSYVVLRIPLDDNFIAVILTIIGYSLNDTIVIYDRIRENRGIMGKKTDIADVANLSLSQTIRRSVNTSVTTFVAVISVGIVCILLGVNSITSFAIPMAIGIVVGCYSSICIAVPLWLTWQKRSKKTKTVEKTDESGK